MLPAPGIRKHRAGAIYAKRWRYCTPEEVTEITARFTYLEERRDLAFLREQVFFFSRLGELVAYGNVENCGSRIADRGLRRKRGGAGGGC